MRNGGDPAKAHGICEVKLSKGKIIYEGKRLSLPEMRRLGRKERRYPRGIELLTTATYGHSLDMQNESSDLCNTCGRAIPSRTSMTMPRGCCG